LRGTTLRSLFLSGKKIATEIARKMAIGISVVGVRKRERGRFINMMLK
jgi:hypothetical protein